MEQVKRIVDKVLGIGEETDPIKLIGNCDIVINGLVSGSVKLQYKLRRTDALPVPAWTDFPDGEFTTDIYHTIFLSDHGTEFKLLGVANNAGVYVRIAYNQNK